MLPTISFVVACFAFSTPVSAAQTVPYKINFQGRLTNASGTALTGTHDMQFKLYTAVSGGTFVWGETRTAANGNAVTVTNGLFNVLIGEGTAVAGSSATLQAAITANSTLFMEVTVGAETLGPRSQFGSSAYAFNSDTLDGLDATAFGQLSSANSWTNTNLIRVTSTAALTVQNSSSVKLLNVDTTNGKVEIGSYNGGTNPVAGKLVVANATNANTVTLATGATAASYTLTLPTTVGASGDCLKTSDAAGTLTFGGCAVGGGAIIVAASNSSQADKDGADFVANGNTAAANDGDQVQINDALTAASGKKVVLLAGTYTVDGSISIPNDTTLTGIGDGTVITVPDSFNASINVVTNAVTGGGGAGVVVKDMKLNGNRINQTSGTMHGIYFDGLGSGFGASATDGGSISGVVATSWMNSGIYLTATANTTIANNTVRDNSGDGMYIFNSPNLTVSDNLVQGNGASGIYFPNSSNSTITDNVIQTSNNAAIFFNSSSQNTISGNVIQSNALYGIYLFGNSNSNIISANNLYDNGGTSNNNAIYLGAADNNSITGNNITDGSAGTTNYAINLTSSSADKNYLSNNLFSSTPGTSTISDLGTGTVYANQARGESGGQLTNRTANNSQAFSVQNASGTAILSADTSANEITIGSATTDTTQILLQLDSFDTFADTATCGATTNQGGLYYNTQTNVIRGCVNGAWEDMVSTAGLGLQLFGVLPDSGLSPGDIFSVTAATNGPCKVSVGATTTTVSWTGCTAYSGGRKVIVAAGTATTTNTVASRFQHLCLTGANSQPALSASGTEVANLATVSFPSVTAPILCLADIKFTGANNTITQIYDTRTFTTTEKSTVTLNSAIGIGSIVAFIATKGTVQTVAVASTNNIAGVVVATTGAASTTTINAIIATSGPAMVKAITGSNTINSYIFTSGTAGYALTATAKPTEGTGTIYNVLGNARTAWTGATACAINSDACAGSVATLIDKR